jgi:vitamin B12/bleomycin/antimicrobial peptide transport system ATP-binding/permease protein
MENEKPLNHRHARDYLIQAVKRFLRSDQVGRRAKWLIALLIAFMFGTNGLSVLNSFVARSFMTAIENHNYAGFVRFALFSIAVYAGSTFISVLYSFTEQRLALLWREWGTKQFVFRYANHRVYYALRRKGEIGNPDQRIADDVRAFTTSTISFLLMFLNGTFTVLAFSGVMWSISPMLFLVSVLYAAAGTYLAYLFGRPLVRLNYDQTDKEADFRSSLTYLRSNAESVALTRREGGLINLSLTTLRALVVNMRRLIGINRNVNFFTTGYNWLIQIIPALLVAPLFIHGKVDFGVITQSAIAFSQLVGAFSLIVTQFQSLTSYAATSARLKSMTEASEAAVDEAQAVTTFSRDQERVACQGLTLLSPRSSRVLIKELSVEIRRGQRVLVRGQDESARDALFQSIAGLRAVSAGHILRPPLDQILFIPEMPYLPPGTMHELLLRPWPEEEGPVEDHLKASQPSHEEMLAALRALKIESILSGFGGLDTRQHWENTLPLHEQQLLVLARVLLARPRFAFLEKPSSTLHHGQVDVVLDLLAEGGISYVTFEGPEATVNLDKYDMLLELKDEGAWSWEPLKGERAVEGVPRATA